jgi:hypothetical protein
MIRRIIHRAAKFHSPVAAQTDEVGMFPADWLVRQTSIQEAEDHTGVRGMRRWNDLKTAIEPGDEIWIFCSPPKMWEAMMGRRGFVLLRNGKEIARVVTVMN